MKNANEVAGIRIRLLSKPKEVFTIKKFPVFLGTGKAPDIIPLHSEGVEYRHIQVFTKSHKLFAKDNSEIGSLINNTLIKGKSVQLKPGANVIQIGKQKLVIENDSIYDSSKKLFTGNDRVYMVSSIIAAVLILLVGSFFLYRYMFGLKEIEIRDFEISKTKLPYPVKDAELSKSELFYALPVYLKSITFISPDIKIDDPDARFYLIFDSKDSIVIDPSDIGVPEKTIKLPPGLISDDKNKDSLKITLKGYSSKYLFNSIEKNFVISNGIQITNERGVQLYSKVQNRKFDYEITSTNNNIKDVEVDFGDGKEKVKDYKGTKIYFDRGIYIVKALIHLKSADPVLLVRKVVIE